MSSEELLSTALRVMGRHMDHREPDPQDVEALRSAAPVETKTEPAIEVLAAQIIDQELKKAKLPAKTIEEVERRHAV